MTLVELADAADVTPRTVRYYIAQGLLPAPQGSGSGASYTEAHLRQLKAIKSLQQHHLPLAEIRARLEQEPSPAAPRSSALEYLNRVMAAGPQLVREPAGRGYQTGGSPATSSAVGSRSTWERHQILPDVELHVRRPLPRDVQRKLDRLLDYARKLTEESP